MSSYRFRLENVYMVRKIHNAMALAELAQATRSVEECAIHERFARERYDALRAPTVPVKGEQFAADQEQGQRLGAALARASEDKRVKELELDRSRERVIITDRAVQALDRLDDRYRARWKAELEKREALEFDDLASANFVRSNLETMR